ncbi:ABC transporter ATP-binding protein [Mesorhizobium sp. YIM 152430]|uniref:ABC transporter ATP-binding protein n=1 Tax=Mesorhizobium sp. YIM 152430 TaxID=3031761 RepID=UPI0023DA33D5|nr:ABC transporter ATP-binding protein [Mesorhizobium sp. YIM 152430]MDF1601785.1 ABC transporter ATP-binding protein [Mesorhizobium sp. YIM 152430]
MLALNSVSRRYGETVALDRLNVAVPADSYVSVLGASGSGKTTLLRIIAGFEEPDAGTVTLDDKRLDGVPPHRRDIGFVFQNFALFPHLSVGDNIAYGLRYREAAPVTDAAEVAHRVNDIIRLVGLEGLASRKVSAISGGQRQRVALARTLVTEPRIVLLDEPLGALDANLRERMCDELRHIRQRLKVTFLHVTGSETEALLMGDIVAVLSRGTIAQFAPAATLFSEPRSADVARHLNAYNILSGKMEGGRFRSPIAAFPLPAPSSARDGTPVEVALRFDRISVRPANSAGNAALRARFITSEFTGSSVLSFFRTEDGQLMQVVSHLSGPVPETYAADEVYSLVFDPAEIVPFFERAA